MPGMLVVSVLKDHHLYGIMYGVPLTSRACDDPSIMLRFLDVSFDDHE